MAIAEDKTGRRRKAVNLTIRADVLEDAKSLHLNASQAAENGIVAAVKKAREEAWLRDNKKALDAYNRRIEKEGPLLPPIWES